MPTNKVLFLSVEYLRDNSIINANVDSVLLEPYIVMAQNIHIEAILGTKLFNSLVDNVASLSVDEKLLIDDYIQPALIQWTMYEALPFINYKFTNKAVSTNSSDNADPVGLEEIHYLRTSIKDSAEYLSERVTKFLKANELTYPLYCDNGDTVDEIHPNKDNFTSGIVLD